MFTQEELKNILVLIERANLTGKEAFSVAVLQQKIQKLIERPPEVSSETTGTDPKVKEIRQSSRSAKGKYY